MSKFQWQDSYLRLSNNIALKSLETPYIYHIKKDELYEIDEKALDMYVEHWNTRQAISGEPLRLNWDVNPRSIDSIGFSTVLI